MFETVTNAIKDYNKVTSVAREPYPSIGILHSGNQASESDINELEMIAGLRIPEELKQFYKVLGSIECNPLNENNSISVFSVVSLINYLQHPDSTQRTSSLGLIDMIKLNWGNDRYEFEEEIDIDVRDYINANYFCFGFYYTEDNMESAHYLYFDGNGKFGTVFYHQDAFDELVEDYLEPLTSESQAAFTLEELLANSIRQITELKVKEVGALNS